MPNYEVKIALTPKGGFNTASAYTILDVVTYSGAAYVFTADKAAGAWDATKVMKLCENGAAGSAASIEIGTVTTAEAETNASVTNGGTSAAAVLNFVIPKGVKGDTGDAGAGITSVVYSSETGKITITVD